MGSFLAPGPTLPPLGLGDVEVTVETAVGPDTPAEEIVDNKTVRVKVRTFRPRHRALKSSVKDAKG